MGRARERQVYVEHFITGSHKSAASSVSHQGWFRLKQLTMNEGQQRFRELHLHYGEG